MTNITKSQKPGRFIGIVITGILFLIIGGVLGVFLWQGLTPPTTGGTDTSSPVLTQYTAEVITNEALEVGVPTGEVVVRIPAWYINVVLREPNLFPEAGEPGWNRPHIVNVEAFDGNDNPILHAIFTMPIEVCFALESAEWDRYAETPGDFRVQFYDEEQSPAKWTDISVIAYADAHSLCGQAAHLSLFALAIKESPTPEIPEATPTEELYSP